MNFTSKLPVLILFFAFCATILARGIDGQQETDEQILENTKNAVEQVRSWNNTIEHEICMKALAGDILTRKGCNEDYKNETKSLEEKATLTWSPKIGPDHYEMSNFGSWALVCDTKQVDSTCEVSRPPAETLSLILLDALRLEMKWFLNLNKADGITVSPNDSVLFLAWKGQWFKTQGAYCRLNPSREYTDLNETKQSCPVSTSDAKPRDDQAEAKKQDAVEKITTSSKIVR